MWLSEAANDPIINIIQKNTQNNTEPKCVFVQCSKVIKYSRSPGSYTLGPCSGSALCTDMHSARAHNADCQKTCKNNAKCLNIVSRKAHWHWTTKKPFSKSLCCSHLQSNPTPTFKLTSAFHTATTIYPSVTPISVKLAPFISKAAVRDTYYTETFSLDTLKEGSGTLYSFTEPWKTLLNQRRLTTVWFGEKKIWYLETCTSIQTLIHSPKCPYFHKKCCRLLQYSTFMVVIISLTMMTVKILQLPVKTHK